LTVTPTSTLPPAHRKYPTPTPASFETENSETSFGAPETVIYSNPPANIYLTLKDGPGNYRLEVLDGKGNHLKTPFDQKVVEEKGIWVYWDGTNEDGEVMPVGTYFAQLSKDGILLKRIVLIRVPSSP
jgi:flagellar hook assembly protein FlgD